MASPALQADLAAERDLNVFCTRALDLAAHAGIDLQRSDIETLPDPAGIMRFVPKPSDGNAWPPAGWLPIGMAADAAGPVVTWQCFDGVALDTPFFQDAANLARSLPFNAPPRPHPAGLIFHLSRCGSTLVHRMLGASATVTSLSEVPIFDEAVQFCLNWQGPQDIKLKVLQTIVAGLSNASGRRPLTLKLDAWHILSWPLLRSAFPDVPAIFLYREPAEVLVSQQRMRGIQAVPQPLIAALCGMDDYSAFGLDEYCAHFLAASCRAAIEAARAGALCPISYKDLPGAVFTRVLAHFGLDADDVALERMREAAGVDSKAPDQVYRPDSEEKNRAAGETLHALAERIVGSDYRALEALAGRIGYRPSSPR
jgi:hypothetical protein